MYCKIYKTGYYRNVKNNNLTYKYNAVLENLLANNVHSDCPIIVKVVYVMNDV